MSSVEEQHHQLLNICKICKKVYKDKTGLMDHQRLQHSQPKISVSQQVQQLALNMNRFNNNRKNNVAGLIRNFTGKDERFNNSGSEGGVKVLRVDQSYATLQKPPASLKPKLLQSRSIQQLTKVDQDDQSSKHSFDDNEGDPDEWKKWEPEKDAGPTIITASMAESTANCYNPIGHEASTSSVKTFPIPQASPSPRLISNPNVASSSKSIPGRIQIPQLKVIGGGPSSKSLQMNAKINSNLSRFHQKLSGSAGGSPSPTASNVNLPGSGGNKGVPQGGLSPSKTLGGKAPVPKLMSKTKAQFQILKSQATRPKINPRNAANNSLPKAGVPTNGAVAPKVSGTNGTAAVTVPVPVTNLTPPKLTKQADLPAPQKINEEKYKNPPQLLRQSENSEGKGKPLTVKKQATQPSTPVKKSPNKPALKGAKGRANAQVVVQKESLNPPPSGSGSGSGSDSSDSEEDSSEEEEEEEDGGPPPAKKVASVPSPPVPKKSQVFAKKSPAKATLTKKSPPSTPKKNLVKKYDSNGEERIFGENYRCPDMDKVASYLNKKGTRVWICLVCEEPEEEVSGGPMICCDTCEDWYHFTCVGIKDEPPEDEKWYCKRCMYKNIQSKLEKSSKGKRSPSPAKPKRGAGGTRGRGGRGGGRKRR